MTAPLASAVAALVENLSIGRSAIELPKLQRTVNEELERAIQRALWRAERRTRRRVPTYAAAHAAPWVNAQRRVMAHEISRHLLSLGAGRELANLIAEEACNRFPRDGVVYEDLRRRPRARGTSPRQLAANPRARGESPRQRGTSPRQRRAPANLSELALANGAEVNDRLLPQESPPTANALPRDHSAVRSIEELAPGWTDLKKSLIDSLEPHERRRARETIRDDAVRLSGARSRRDPSEPPT